MADNNNGAGQALRTGTCDQHTAQACIDVQNKDCQDMCGAASSTIHQQRSGGVPRDNGGEPLKTSARGNQGRPGIRGRRASPNSWCSAATCGPTSLIGSQAWLSTC